jgi:hypothetical protein
MKSVKVGLKLPIPYVFRKNAVWCANFPIALRECRKIAAFVTYDQQASRSIRRTEQHLRREALYPTKLLAQGHRATVIMA